MLVFKFLTWCIGMQSLVYIICYLWLWPWHDLHQWISAHHHHSQFQVNGKLNGLKDQAKNDCVLFKVKYWGVGETQEIPGGQITTISCKPWAKMDWVLLAYSYMVMSIWTRRWQWLRLLKVKTMYLMTNSHPGMLPPLYSHVKLWLITLNICKLFGRVTFAWTKVWRFWKSMLEFILDEKD